MSLVYPYMVMTDVQAAQINEATRNLPVKLTPERVQAGFYQGNYILAARILKVDQLQTAEYDEVRGQLSMLEVVAIDREEAFPPSEEELAAQQASEAE